MTPAAMREAAAKVAEGMRGEQSNGRFIAAAIRALPATDDDQAAEIDRLSAANAVLATELADREKEIIADMDEIHLLRNDLEEAEANLTEALTVIKPFIAKIAACPDDVDDGTLAYATVGDFRAARDFSEKMKGK